MTGHIYLQLHVYVILSIHVYLSIHPSLHLTYLDLLHAM